MHDEYRVIRIFVSRLQNEEQIFLAHPAHT